MSQTGNAPDASRRRTRTGCITCRIRRVKCDETRPACLRCVQSRRTCDGYGPAQTARVSRQELAEALKRLSTAGPASRVLTAGVPGSENAGSSFDFFRFRTAPQAGAFLSSGFWDRRFLQVAHAEPAIWQAAASLGYLHRRWEQVALSSTRQGLDSEFSKHAMACYGRALTLGKEIRDPCAMLVLSLALATVSNLSGRWADSRVHFLWAERLLAQLGNDAATSSSLDIDDIVDTLTRMDLERASFSEASAPYSFPDEPTRPLKSPAHAPITSLKRAATQLLGIMQRLMAIWWQGPAIPSPEHPATIEKQMAVEQIGRECTQWEHQLMGYLSATGSGDVEQGSTTLLWLKLHHTSLRMLLRYGISCEQTRFDSCLPHFERIIALSAALIRSTQSLVSPVMTVDPGLVMSLYLAATRCRHPILRRRALALLRRANRQEGVWHSIGCAAVAERLMILEEKGLGIDAYLLSCPQLADLEKAAEVLEAEALADWLSGDGSWTSVASWEGVIHVPESSRYGDMIFSADPDTGRVELTLIYSGCDENGRLRTRNEVVTF